jgi:hypothetical protein
MKLGSCFSKRAFYTMTGLRYESILSYIHSPTGFSGC